MIKRKDWTEKDTRARRRKLMLRDKYSRGKDILDTREKKFKTNKEYQRVKLSPRDYYPSDTEME